MVIIISLLMVRRKPYGTISHGIVEVPLEGESYLLLGSSQISGIAGFEKNFKLYKSF
ncbi:APLP1: Amyloid-like 1 [Crotalus adamanteus]|uniref:APLP1: Amyloid-like 1 n=1 Tax=Crotalus adamanteus TaxID=8729 RepID=A0AAW1AZL1_CROAD